MAGRDDAGASDFDSQEEEEEIPWISWFCTVKGNEFFCEVDEDYVQDDFNLTGLSSMVPFYDYAMDLILDMESPASEELTEEQQQMVEGAAETLYGLIHARFLLTNRGLKLMEEKYQMAGFGRCPRVMCGGQPVVPVGEHDTLHQSSVKVYCPKCNDIYFPRSVRHKNLDGAYWGTTFPHLFFMTYPELVPPKPKVAYVPKIYGFRIHKTSVVNERRGEGDAEQQRPAVSDRTGAAA